MKNVAAVLLIVGLVGCCSTKESTEVKVVERVVDLPILYVDTLYTNTDSLWNKMVSDLLDEFAKSRVVTESGAIPTKDWSAVHETPSGDSVYVMFSMRPKPFFTFADVRAPLTIPDTVKIIKYEVAEMTIWDRLTWAGLGFAVGIFVILAINFIRVQLRKVVRDEN